MIRRPPRSTQSRSSAASDVYKRQREMLDGGVAEPALRHGNRAAKGFVVGGVRDELEVAHQVASLAAVVEADRANQPIRHGTLAKRLLERAALRIGAIHDREVAQP